MNYLQFTDNTIYLLIGLPGNAPRYRKIVGNARIKAKNCLRAMEAGNDDGGVKVPRNRGTNIDVLML